MFNYKSTYLREFVYVIGRFPVVFVDKWEDIFDNPNATEVLQEWRHTLAPYFEPGQ